MKLAFVTFAVLTLVACGGRGRSTSHNPSSESGGRPSATTPVPAAEDSATGALLPDLAGRRVVIGTDPTTPPFESVDPKTNGIVGFDIDVMGAIGRLIHIEPEFRSADFKTIFAGLDAGEFDAVISASTITEDRKRMVAFSDPYVEVAQLVVVRKGTDRIGGLEDLKGRGILVGVQTGTTGEQVARTNAQVADKNLRRYDTVALALADLANGSIDAIIDDQPILLNYLSQPEYRDRLVLVGKLSVTESYGIAVNKKDTVLLQAINAALRRLRAEGVLDRLAAEHHVR